MRLNLSTEGLASASARHPWLTLAAWAAIVVGAIVLISTLFGDAMTNDVSFTNNPESEQAETLLEERLRGPEQTREVLIVRSTGSSVDDPGFQAFTRRCPAWALR
jgi:RND superfamily putative drug exporter